MREDYLIKVPLNFITIVKYNLIYFLGKLLGEDHKNIIIKILNTYISAY